MDRFFAACKEGVEVQGEAGHSLLYGQASYGARGAGLLFPFETIEGLPVSGPFGLLFRLVFEYVR